VLQCGGRSLQEDGGAVMRAFPRPELRLDIVDRGALAAGAGRFLGCAFRVAGIGNLRSEGRSEDRDAVGQREVVERFVIEIE
jgi:hypothetical protein